MAKESTIDLLKKYESRNVTFFEDNNTWPITWKRARGVQVWDEKGKKYLDLTGAFGVAATGHANKRVVRAAEIQMRDLLHAMGDVHPPYLRGCALQIYVAGRRQRRAACRMCAEKLEGAALDRRRPD